MTERIKIKNLEGSIMGVVHMNEGRRIGFTVSGVTTQINGGGLDGQSVASHKEKIPEYDMFGRIIPEPVALADLERWQELQKRRTPADIEAIKKMPLSRE